MAVCFRPPVQVECIEAYLISPGHQLLVTGAGGFVGRALTLEAVARGLTVRAASRCYSAFPAMIECVSVGDIDGCTDWLNALKDCDVVVHLAARVHVMHDTKPDPLTEFRKVNVDGTLNLACQAVVAGVKRFVFISSIGVNGAETFNSPFVVQDEPAPHSPYAVSKHEAELGLQALAFETGMELVIIRPPIVYGPNAPGNFGSLINWLSRGLPLPLGAVTQNRRSLVALDNLVDFILTCLQHPKAANRTFLVSDGEDLSTAKLLQRMGKAMYRPARLLPVPVSLLTVAARLLGKTAVAQRLLSSLQVDISETCELLGWRPPVSVDEGLRRAAQRRV
jgi:nucleoside-diphosphate-sugar epimerase